MIIRLTCIINLVLSVMIWAQAIDEPNLSIGALSIVCIWAGMNILASVSWFFSENS